MNGIIAAGGIVLVALGGWIAMFVAHWRSLWWLPVGCLIALLGWVAIVFQGDLLP